MSKLVEDIVICVVLALGLSISFYFLVATVEWGQDYPPHAVSAFLGIAVAALTYRFLDGGQSSEFKLGVLKLGGSAALLFGFTYFGGQWIASDQKLYAETEEYRRAIGTLEERLKIHQETIEKRDTRIIELEDKIGSLPSARRVLTLQEIRKLSPNDALVKRIRQMVIGNDPPFGEVMSSLQVGISVAVLRGQGSRYTICAVTLEKLRGEDDGINTNVRLSRTPENLGDPVHITAQRNGEIDQDRCADPDTDFEVQINCEAALELFPDKVDTCAASGALRGEKVTISSLPL